MIRSRSSLMVIPVRRFLAVAASAVAIGCGSGEGGGSGGPPSIQDSAGIQVVVNHGPTWASGQAWTVADQPTVDVGGAGDPTSELGRVVGAVKLSDGRLVVANAATNDLRFFDPQGKYLQTRGRQGTGPGEYQTITGMWLGSNDSLLIADVASQRLTVLDGRGELARTFSLGGVSGIQVPTGGRMSLAFPTGWFRDGSVLGMQMGFRINDQRQGAYRDTVTLVRYGPDGAARDTVTQMPGVEMEQLPLTIGNRTAATPNPVPLGKTPVMTVAGERVLVSDNDAWRVEVRGSDGALRRIIRVDAKPQPITAADKAANRKQQLDQLAATPQLRALPAQLQDQFKSRIENAKYPETLPFLGSIVPAADGTVWVEEVVGPSTERRRFAVLDSTGVLLGRVTMPAKFRPTFVDAASVVGVWTDPDDLEHVRAYPIKK
jgi:6-bladed beta-propeller